MTVDVHKSIDAVDLTEWDDVVSEAGAPVFYQAHYLRTYERFPLTDIESFSYFVVRDRGRAVAVLPVSLLRGLDPLRQLRARYPVTGEERGLLSHVWHCYDAWIPGASTPAHVAAVTGAMCDLARDLGAAWYGFVNVPAGSWLREALLAEGFPAHHIEDRYQVDLRGMTRVDDFIAGARPTGRKNYRRNGRRAADAGVRVRVAPPRDVDLAAVTALCAATSKRHGTGGYYPEELFTGFVTALGDAACVIEIHEEERLVGVAVSLRDRTRFHAWACGVHYDVGGNYSPYPLLYTTSVAQALAEGRDTLEGGRGNHVFKRRHGLTPLALDACLLPARPAR